MKRGLQKGISLLTVMVMLMSLAPMGVAAKDTSAENKAAAKQESQSVNGTETDAINSTQDVNVSETKPITTTDEKKTLEYQGFRYQEEQGGLTLISYSGKLNETKILEIPEKIDNKAITQIAKEAFKDNKEIKEVKIPKGVAKIDGTAFYGCTGLEKITVDKDNTAYYDENGKLYQSNNKELVIKPENWKDSETNKKVTEVVPNDKTTSIGTAAENGNEKITIKSLDEIPVLSENSDIANQIVVIYKQSSDSNIQSLSLTTNEISGVEHVSDRVDVFEINTKAVIETMINKISESPNVLAVDKNQKIEITALPNDPYIINGSAWQFQNIGTDKTWNTVSNSTPVVVAVLDTGLNTNHPDLQGRSVNGYDYIRDTTAVIDLMGHGTWVSGCAAAVANNGIGIAGIAGTANVKIAPYRVGGKDAEDYYIYTAYECAALMAAGDRSDVKVINMSFGHYGGTNDVEAAAIKYAADRGKILLASSGNEGNNYWYAGQYSYPASYDNVISVAATTSNNDIAYFSQYNDRVDLSAPGVAVYTTSKDGAYGAVSGTSFSSPITAGACAVLLAASPNLGAAGVEKALKDTANDLGSPGKDNDFGYGLIRLDQALASVKPLTVDSFKADKASGQNINTSINLTAAGSGGKTPYLYKFYYKLGTATTVIRDFSAT
ncbi:S8 family serine peptidase, partial [Acetobacterium sp.]|uniref:S8 family serine peptidase n=1 Tax=Acetobacterium sp. TaxID=1872094 RepID=UPI002F3FB627